MRRREFIATLGGAAAWPVVARAQQPAKPVIGFMSARSPEDTVEVLKAFHNGLEQGGFIDGRNVNIEYRWARGDYSRLPVLANELIGRRIDVLVATGGDRAARAAKEATATIPVVFNMGSDPVKAGLVKSFDQPGGNVTGSVLLADTLEPKRLALLHEIVPNVALFGALVNPTYPAAADQLRDLEAAVGAVVGARGVGTCGRGAGRDCDYGRCACPTSARVWASWRCVRGAPSAQDYTQAGRERPRHRSDQHG